MKVKNVCLKFKDLFPLSFCKDKESAFVRKELEEVANEVNPIPTPDI